jgi:Ca2+-binding EF-hand superfamily protein
MSVYLENIEKPTIESLWKKIGGDKKGYVTIEEMLIVFDKNMPKCFDRDIAFEIVREIDSDKDGRLTYKDFYECIKF